MRFFFCFFSLMGRFVLIEFFSSSDGKERLLFDLSFDGKITPPIEIWLNHSIDRAKNARLFCERKWNRLNIRLEENKWLNLWNVFGCVIVCWRSWREFRVGREICLIDEGFIRFDWMSWPLEMFSHPERKHCLANESVKINWAKFSLTFSFSCSCSSLVIFSCFLFGNVCRRFVFVWLIRLDRIGENEWRRSDDTSIDHKMGQSNKS